ncbi:MAG: hypothetical protein WC342_02620 [Methanoregula sp.]|jgi:hypothetical protein
MNVPRGILSCTAIASLILALALVAGCTGLQPRPDGLPQSGQYAFLDHQVYYTGMLVNGTCPAPVINVEAYRFDPEKKTLAGIVPFTVNESLLLVYGNRVTLSGGYGNGSYGSLVGAYTLPFESGNLSVNGFTRNGTMYLTYQNQTISLDPGTRWVDVATATETTTACTINRTVTDSITYYGNYPQSGILKTKLA